MAFTGRRAGTKRGGPGAGLRPGLALSALLHLGFAALVVLASLRRERPAEPLPPPSYEVQFEGGAPERPAEQEADPPPGEAEAALPDVADEAPATPPTAAVEAPAPEEAPAPPEERQPPTPEDAQTAEADPPRSDEVPPEPEQAQTAEGDMPRSEEDLPVPPPPPPQPQREAALTALPARPPPRPPSPERLPGLYLPGAGALQPAPRPSPSARRGFDLSPGPFTQSGRNSPEPQMSLRGAKVGPDWYSALRRWWIDNRRYPANAAVVGDQGAATVEMDLAPDGRVRSVRLTRPSGSVWLDAGAVSQFRGATLPALPPGTDPSGAVLTFQINYVLIR